MEKVYCILMQYILVVKALDIYQTVISHYPHWSKIELIAVVIVMIISFIILDRF